MARRESKREPQVERGGFLEEQVPFRVGSGDHLRRASVVRLREAGKAVRDPRRLPRLCLLVVSSQRGGRLRARIPRFRLRSGSILRSPRPTPTIPGGRYWARKSADPLGMSSAAGKPALRSAERARSMRGWTPRAPTCATRPLGQLIHLPLPGLFTAQRGSSLRGVLSPGRFDRTSMVGCPAATLGRRLDNPKPLARYELGRGSLQAGKPLRAVSTIFERRGLLTGGFRPTDDSSARFSLALGRVCIDVRTPK